MQLEYKPDFDKTLARFEAWWDCQIVDRPPVFLWPRSDKKPKGAKPKAKTYATLRERWMDMEAVVEQVQYRMANGLFFADTLPIYYPNVGPELTATAFGADLDFGEVTSWSKPIANSIRDVLKLKPNLDNPYWNAIRKGTELSLAAGKGKWITGMPDLHTNGDLPASFRDPQELCMDLADDLEGVRLAVEHVTKFFAMMYEDTYNLIAPHGLPSTSWSSSLHMGKSYITSCDFICMISEDMFRKTILPSLVVEMEYLEKNYFHLDGPGALRHLNALLEQPRLNGIQWVYGAGGGPAAKWIDVYKRIQAAGKCMQLIAEDWNDAKAVIEHLKPQGVWLCISGGDYSLDEANGILKAIERWTAGGKI